MKDAGLVAVHYRIPAVTVWKWKNSKDMKNVSRWNEVICLGTEDNLDRKAGACGTWHLCKFVKTSSTVAWKAKPEVHWTSVGSWSM